MSDPIVLRHLGEMPYLEALELQKEMASARAREAIGDTALFLTHPHTFTIGRRGSREDILVSEGELSALGVQVHDVDRGGKVTYHGPGQWVVYPIFKLERRGGDVVGYVRQLEEVMIRVAARLGVTAGRIPGLTGVWVGDRKIGAIGVRLHLGVTYHGLALNVAPDLSYFGRIIPCGITDKGVSSLQAEGAPGVTMEGAGRALEGELLEVFGARKNMDGAGRPEGFPSGRGEARHIAR